MGDSYCFCCTASSLGRRSGEWSLQKAYLGSTLVEGQEAGQGFRGREEFTCLQGGSAGGRASQSCPELGDGWGRRAPTPLRAALGRGRDPRRGGAIQGRLIPRDRQQRPASGSTSGSWRTSFNWVSIAASVLPEPASDPSLPLQKGAPPPSHQGHDPKSDPHHLCPHPIGWDLARWSHVATRGPREQSLGVWPGEAGAERLGALSRPPRPRRSAE